MILPPATPKGCLESACSSPRHHAPSGRSESPFTDAEYIHSFRYREINRDSINFLKLRFPSFQYVFFGDTKTSLLSCQNHNMRPSEDPVSHLSSSSGCDIHYVIHLLKRVALRTPCPYPSSHRDEDYSAFCQLK